MQTLTIPTFPGLSSSPQQSHPKMSNDPKKKTSISIKADILDHAYDRRHHLEYKNFSEYVEFLIAYDLERRGAHSIVRDETGTHYQIAPNKLELPPAEGGKK